MNCRTNYVNLLHIQSHQCQNLSFLSQTNQQFHVWRRRRLKIDTKLTIRTQLGGGGGGGPMAYLPLDNNLFQTLISSLNSFDLIAPALGFASGFALAVSRSNTNEEEKKVELKEDHDEEEEEEEEEEGFDTVECVLFASPTPFNRFVMLRCPSLLFEGNELLEEVEDVTEKLVKDETHFVKLNNGSRRRGIQDMKSIEKLVYQRVCISTEDGGVVSLDWPANLDLTERGMDTTLLLVPGTTQGSMDVNVRSFVTETLNHGCFPVVMNPRGCAASPLTTPRLFTAADSDDICTAVQYINSARPWTTLMGVGWGYGANMLTKYLAEVAERTPLTAAACIDNPFDLEEATRSSHHHIVWNQKLCNGFKDILRSNKELFQGRQKGFNLEKALSATSIRDFDQAISMVSYGYETIEEFYSKSSTRQLVDNMKIPVLFIQTENGTAAPFSIPRSSITENLFTSLLLCTYLPSNTISERSMLPWCQGLALEWLTAVELGLLKGRHPLLKDVDVTINPSKGLGLVQGRPSDENRTAYKRLNFTQSHALNNYKLDGVKDTLEENNITVNESVQEQIDPELKQEDTIDITGDSSCAELVKEEGENPPDSEESQVVPTAQMVMNMLDVTMPGTLAEDKKKQVLTAIEKGETLVKALEGAVPEEVRGKITSSVSEIMKSREMKLNLRNAGQTSNELPKLTVKSQETFDGPLNASGGPADVLPTELMKQKDGIPDGSDKTQREELEQGRLKSEDSNDMATLSSGNDETISGPGSKPDQHINDEQAVDTDCAASAQVSDNQDSAMPDVSTKDDSSIQNDGGKSMNESTDQNTPIPSIKTEESPSPSTPSTGPSVMDKEGNDIQKGDENNIQSVADQSKQIPTGSEESSPLNTPASNPSPLNVTQAFNALTGFDNSTQVAVNSVFGVLENMIVQLEENEHENGGKQDKHYDQEVGESSEGSTVSDETENKSLSKENGKSTSMFVSNGLPSDSFPVNSSDEKFSYLHDGKKRVFDNKLNQNYTSSAEHNSGSNRINTSGSLGKDNDKRVKDLVDPEILVKRSHEVGQLQKVPLIVAINPHGDSLYNEYLRKYLLSKVAGSESLDLDSTTDLLLDYFPEEGQWKFLHKTGANRDQVNNIRTGEGASGKSRSTHSSNDTDQIIETSYIILDKESKQLPLEEHGGVDDIIRKLEKKSPRSEKLISIVKNIILDSLTVEVGRRLGVTDLKEIEPDLVLDLERVADAVSVVVGHNNNILENKEPALKKVGMIQGESIIKAISSALKNTSYLREVLPAGVIVGSSLASLRKYFSVASQNDNLHNMDTVLDRGGNLKKKFYGQVGEFANDRKVIGEKAERSVTDSFMSRASESLGNLNLSNENIMVGAVTAALGASSFLITDQKEQDKTVETSSRSLSEKTNQREHNKVAISDKNHNNIVTSLAEKAMSVAAPVVPTKGDGEVDQDRLVAMLADLGQRGGVLNLIGKVALLWGGLRGAMSLTDRLIIFLHISKRPLIQRILGFVCMVLVLWSPVVIPLFPMLVQSLSVRKSTGIAEYACIAGLYTAVVILIMLWGKRVREYKRPLAQYGLDLTSVRKLKDFMKGVIGGVVLVLSIHSINALLGFGNLSWPSTPSSPSPDAMMRMKVYGGILMLGVRGLVTATVVAIVEELFFRSWLPEEISVDFGFHWAVIFSGLAFSILQRSLPSVLGLWMLSFALSGARQTNGGSLAIPIGMRAGIMSSCFMLQTGGFVKLIHQEYPLWLTGTPYQPFSGVVGQTLTIILALLLYRRATKTPFRLTETSKEDFAGEKKI